VIVRITPWLLALLLMVGSLCFAQHTTNSQGFPPPPRPVAPANPDDVARAEMEKEMAKAANKQRQEQIKTDTDKLLKLATELKQYVDKSNENTLSLDVVKKAEEIEKLAHNVKEKMKGD
jgi:hypothetical protein